MLWIVLLVIIGFSVLTLLVVFYWRYITDRAVMHHFRAAEAISDGHLPPEWRSEIDRRVHRKRMKDGRTGTDLALEKLTALRTFMTDGPLALQEPARTVLLGQIDAAQRRWEHMSWEELRATTPPTFDQ